MPDRGESPGHDEAADHEEPPVVEPASRGELSERDLALLEFERQWWKEPGSKEQALRERFGVSPTRYYQLVNVLVDREAAMRHDPMLVKRLRRARAARLTTRSARRLTRPG